MRSMHTHTISNGKLTASFISLGACLVDLRLSGWDRSLVLGFPQREDYERTDHYAGAVIGRYANRIRHGRATVDGTLIQLSRNGGNHHLHGGETGLARQDWKIVECSARRLVMECESPSGHEGYPGTVHVTAAYEIVGPASLHTRFTATTDSSTLINLCQHPYFNFTGAPDVFSHQLEIQATHYLPSDAELIPTGQIAPVAGTPFDFRLPRQVGECRPHPGFNNTYCLGTDTAAEPRFAARLSASSGPSMELWTTQPGLHLYDGYKLRQGLRGADGTQYGPNSGLCLEAQGWPDSPNNPNFPSTVVHPGEIYVHTTEYRFKS